MTLLAPFTGSRRAADGSTVALPGPALAVVTLHDGEEHTIAVVGDMAVAAFADGRVLPHETVSERRVEYLAAEMLTQRTASEPVSVTHRPSDALCAATAAVIARPPDLVRPGVDQTAADGGGTSDVTVARGPDDLALWIVTDPLEQVALTDGIEAAGRLYLADGHHRSAAAVRIAARAPRSDASARILTAVIPCDQLRVRAFHRRLDGVDLRAEAVVRHLRAHGLALAQLDGPAVPRGPGRMTLTAQGEWWSVDARPRRRTAPRDELEITLAEREVISPLLAAASVSRSAVAARAGARIRATPVPASHGLAALSRRGAIGIALHPEPIEAVLDAAEVGEPMPAKTTYVEPRFPAGLLSVSR